MPNRLNLFCVRCEMVCMRFVGVITVPLVVLMGNWYWPPLPPPCPGGLQNYFIGAKFTAVIHATHTTKLSLCIEHPHIRRWNVTLSPFIVALFVGRLAKFIIVLMPCSLRPNTDKMFQDQGGGTNKSRFFHWAHFRMSSFVVFLPILFTKMRIQNNI